MIQNRNKLSSLNQLSRGFVERSQLKNQNGLPQEFT
jgi:hypothetical protein